METTEVEVISDEPLALELYEQTNALKIHDEATKQQAGAVLTEAAARVKVLEALRVEEKAKILEAGRDCDARWNGRKKPYLDLIADLKPRLEAFLDAERKAAEEAARIANERAEAERRKLEEKAAEDARKAEEARAAGEDKKADRLESRAEQKLEKAETLPTYVPAPPPKVAGVTAARPWKAKLTDLPALIHAAFHDPDPVVRTIARGMLKIEWSQAEGNSQARKTGNTVKIPGVVFAQETSVRGAGGR